MQPNPIPLFASALIPLVVGFIWYHERLLGKAWREAAGLSAEEVGKGPKPMVFVVAIVLSILLAAGLMPNVIHQSAVASLFVSQEGFGDPSSPMHQQFEAIMAQVAGRHRTFGHGALHGALTGLFFALPILGTNGMFERRSWKLNFINAGYWIVTLALMGGVICQFA